MPGVLLTEAMAQSSGWLLLGVTKFERMPFLAMVKEAKMRGFVSPGQLLTIEAKIEHEGSGFAVTSAKGRVGKELKCSADLTFRQIPFPDPSLRVHMDADGRTGSAFRCRRSSHERTQGSLDHRHRHRVLARRRTRRALGRPQRAARQCRRASALRPTSCTRWRRSASTRRFRKRATSARWKPGSASAPMPPALRWIPPASRATRKFSARMDMIVAAGGGERDVAGRSGHPATPTSRAMRVRHFSTKG